MALESLFKGLNFTIPTFIGSKWAVKRNKKKYPRASAEELVEVRFDPGAAFYNNLRPNRSSFD
jgi:hypothetical protein